MTDFDSMDSPPCSDFPARLERLRALTGLSWVAFARELGVRHERVNRWRGGVTPNDRGMAALMRVAKRVPGGLEVLLGGDDGDRLRAA